MEAYLVRHIDDQEFVGIFVASSKGSLADIIDEATDPNLCEYARLGEGGISAPSPGAPKAPTNERDVLNLDEQDSDDWVDVLNADLSVTEDWLVKKLRWKRVCESGELWLPGVGFRASAESEHS